MIRINMIPDFTDFGKDGHKKVNTIPDYTGFGKSGRYKVITGPIMQTLDKLVTKRPKKILSIVRKDFLFLHMDLLRDILMSTVP